MEGGGGRSWPRNAGHTSLGVVSSLGTICYSCRVSDDGVKAKLERLRAENAQLKHTASLGVTLKVSEKGGVSVYGRD